MHRAQVAIVLMLAASPSGSVQLSPLVPADGCGCSFTLRDGTDLPVFARDLDEDGATIGVNGKAIRLTQVSFSEERKVQGAISLGDRIKETLNGDGVNVAFEYEVTFVCPKDDESCEVTEYKGALDVSVGKTRKTFMVKGACGC
jgi:hypothetical protein